MTAETQDAPAVIRPRRSAPSAARSAWTSLLFLGALAGCRSLSDHKGGPSRTEIESAKSRIDRARDVAIENQLATDDDEEKAFWLSILRSLGDFRDELVRKAQR